LNSAARARQAEVNSEPVYFPATKGCNSFMWSFPGNWKVKAPSQEWKWVVASRTWCLHTPLCAGFRTCAI